MEINENAPGNVSQSPVTRTTDNETGFDPNSRNEPGPTRNGDTEPLPLANEPLVTTASGNGQDSTLIDEKAFDELRNDKAEDPDLPVNPPPVDEDEEPSPGSSR
ncbi:hypothetical protein ASF84_12825 [Pseudomonas sp. Leaf127]|uniref:hypothetical protein n=1 Tax=Pseudomonas sp. Leaf127 TaxID=1736267 RepID=UPI0007029530|nr:hypothetical protein [Pseudomonas sp. Leaf127]KQQ56170.1 hypothetical protein ASF84_12825 [Pseudomonas sp. Leaf127]